MKQRKPASVHSKIIIQLDQAAHNKLVKLAESNYRTIRDQARYLIMKALEVEKP